MAEPLKNIFFTRTSLAHLAECVHHEYPQFDTRRFLALVFDKDWPARELKDRMRHVTRCLGQTLPPDYARALDSLKPVAPHITGFDAMVFPDFVEVFGQDDWDRSLPALGYFTRFASAEFAIRPFLHRDPERALAYVRQWAADPDPNVRRLASEGCRPRLPWAMALPKFKADPRPLLPILEMLKADEAETVRHSVANHLNDISKDHPALMLEVCERWRGHSERTDWIIKHACRGLLKAGNRRALKLFGFGKTRQVTVSALRLKPKRLGMGETLTFSFTLNVAGKSRQSVRLEYAIDFVKARGGTSRKVFQVSENDYEPGTYTFSRRHSFADRTTRKHYAGQHTLTVIANGVAQAHAAFHLNAP